MALNLKKERLMQLLQTNKRSLTLIIGILVALLIALSNAFTGATIESEQNQSSLKTQRNIITIFSGK